MTASSTTAAAPPGAPPAMPANLLAADLARRLIEGSRSAARVPWAVWLAMAAIFHANWLALAVIAVGASCYTITTLAFVRLRTDYARDPASRSADAWRKRHMLTSLASGSTWGISGAIVMSMAGDPARALLYVLLLGLATGSANVRAAHRPSMLAYMLPLLGLPSLALAAHGDIASLTTAGCGMVYMLFLIMVAMGLVFPPVGLSWRDSWVPRSRKPSRHCASPNIRAPRPSRRAPGSPTPSAPCAPASCCTIPRNGWWSPTTPMRTTSMPPIPICCRSARPTSRHCATA